MFKLKICNLKKYFANPYCIVYKTIGPYYTMVMRPTKQFVQAVIPDNENNLSFGKVINQYGRYLQFLTGILLVFPNARL